MKCEYVCVQILTLVPFSRRTGRAVRKERFIFLDRKSFLWDVEREQQILSCRLTLLVLGVERV